MEISVNVYHNVKIKIDDDKLKLSDVRNMGYKNMREAIIDIIIRFYNEKLGSGQYQFSPAIAVGFDQRDMVINYYEKANLDSHVKKGVL